MSWKYSQDIIHRKLRYLKTLASEDGIDISMEKWLALLKQMGLEISWETVWRNLIDLYLKLFFGFDWDDFDWGFDDWNMPDDWTFPDEWDWEPPTFPDDENPFDPNDDADVILKAHWDVSHYNLCYFDPPEITMRDIERYAWWCRYRVAEKETAEYKQQSLALKNKLTQYKQSLIRAGVRESYLDGIEEIISMVESRLLRGFCVGFAVIGVSRVSQRHQTPDPFRATVETRLVSDWKTTKATESVVAWESIVGWSRVGYHRVGNFNLKIQRWLSQAILHKINAFWLRSGLVTPSQVSRYGGVDYYQYAPSQYMGYAPADVQVLWQRVFMLQRVDQYHYKGGAEQLKMQFNTKRIRPLLDKAGVISMARGMYHAFAHEIFYHGKSGHKLYKQWKRLITEEDIILKYISFGCDETLLRRVKGMVKP